MSRGPGRWQRLLLDLLDEYDEVPVSYAVQNNSEGQPTRAAQVAARRAAKRLVEDGRARAVYRKHKDAGGAVKPLLTLTSPDSDLETNLYPTSGLPGWVTGTGRRRGPQMSREEAEALTDAIRDSASRA